MPYGVLFFVFSLVAGGVLALGFLAGTSRRGARWVSGAALAAVAATLAAAYAGGATLLGRPKPARLEIVAQADQDAQLAGAYYVEGEAIYLWLLREGEEAPRAYALPWSQETAEDLQRARGEAQANGTQVQVRGTLQPRSPDSRVQFYAPPQPPMPAKVAG